MFWIEVIEHEQWIFEVFCKNSDTFVKLKHIVKTLWKCKSDKYVAHGEGDIQRWMSLNLWHFLDLWTLKLWLTALNWIGSCKLWRAQVWWRSWKLRADLMLSSVMVVVEVVLASDCCGWSVWCEWVNWQLRTREWSEMIRTVVLYFDVLLTRCKWWCCWNLWHC